MLRSRRSADDQGDRCLRRLDGLDLQLAAARGRGAARQWTLCDHPPPADDRGNARRRIAGQHMATRVNTIKNLVLLATLTVVAASNARCETSDSAGPLTLDTHVDIPPDY